jgi:hypothetical protein
MRIYAERNKIMASGRMQCWITHQANKDEALGLRLQWKIFGPCWHDAARLRAA